MKTYAIQTRDGRFVATKTIVDVDRGTYGIKVLSEKITNDVCIRLSLETANILIDQLGGKFGELTAVEVEL